MKKRPKSVHNTSDKSKRTGGKIRLPLVSTIIACICLATIAVAGVFFSRVPQVSAAAQIENGVSPEAMAQIEALIREKESRTGVQTKMDSQLIYELKMRKGQAVADGVRTVETDLEYKDTARSIIELDVKAKVTDALLGQLKANGAQIISSVPAEDSLRISVNVDRIEAVAALADVIYVQPKQDAMTSQRNLVEDDRKPTRSAAGRAGRKYDLPPNFEERAVRVQEAVAQALNVGPQTNVAGTPVVPIIGSRRSEADVTHRVYTTRGTFHVDGTGIKIGVLSDGVTNLAASQALGDLGPVTVLPGQAGAGDEGTAMLELIHDLAPNAQLFFATAFTSITSFANNIRALRDAGCQIIVDDVFYFAETPFQDGQAPSVVSNTNGGAVIQAVNDVTATGVLYFSSAGNSGNLNDGQSGVWEGDFVDGGAIGTPLPGTGNLHNFSSQNFNTITVAAGGTRPVTLYWSDPLGGSANDYDLFILNSTGTSVLASSTNIQNGTQDPFEATGQAVNLRVVIVRRAGAASRFLHLNTNRGRLSIGTSGTTHGHNSAAEAYGVAATPAVGPFPNAHSGTNTVETFSSDGPRRIFFQANGTPITPGNFSATGGLVRQKPDITAADGTSVTGVGGFPTPFFGTSAAAPHAAAIAALIKQANPAFTPAQIRTALTSSAIDIEAPGVDRDSGVGIINPFAAMQALGVAGTAFLELGTITANEDPGDGNGLIDPGDGANLLIQLKNTGVVAATAINATLTSPTPGVIITLPNTSPYPDLAALGGSGTNTMPFRFTVDNSITCPATLTFNLTVSYTGGGSPQVLTFTIPIGAPSVVISSTLDTTAPAANPLYTATTGLQTPRLNRIGGASTCATPKAFPGIFGTGTRRFDAYTFATCAGSAPRCATITLTNACTGTNPAMFVAAYLNSFDPNNLATNWLGDPGSSQIAGGPSSFSVNVPAGASVVIVVSEVNQNLALGCNYTLRIDGLCVPCSSPNQIPVAKCKNVIVSAGADCTANASIDDGSSDPDGGALTITQSPAGPYALGTTTVLLTVTDPRGATSQCMATVTVVDTTLPTITCPANITQSNDPNQCGAVVTYPSPSVSDNCPIVSVFTCNPPSGAVFQVGTTTVTCSITDGSGNMASCPFTITVNDTQAPTIQCPTNVTAVTAPTCPPAINTVVTFPPPTASDNCPGVTTLCNPPSGSSISVGVTTVTCTATDASGNTNTCMFTITVFNARIQDDTNPASVILFNTFTGDYRACCGGMVFTGVGTVTAQGCDFTLQHNPAAYRVLAKWSSLYLRGSGSVQSPPGTLKCTITDRDIRNNTSLCP